MINKKPPKRTFEPVDRAAPMSPKFEKMLADLQSGDMVRTLNATIELNTELSMA